MRYETLKIAARAGAVYVLACVSAFALTPVPAQAQSLFQMLFGNANSPSSGRPPLPPSHLMPPGGGAAFQPGYGIRYPLSADPGRGFYSPRERDEELPTQVEKGQGYRTVCVRLCDGYYWPISYSAPRSRFYHDANVCQSSCAGEARLFHYPTSGGSIEDAVDQTGRVYGRLANAYRYRKALVEGCACKPAPWSEAEVIRHERYALAEKAAAPSRVAGTSADASAAGPGGLLLDAGETRHAGIGPAAGVDDQRAANGAAVEARPEPRRRAAAASEKPASRRIADRPAQLRRVAAIASEQAAPGQQSPQRRRRIVAPAGWGGYYPPGYGMYPPGYGRPPAPTYRYR